MLKKIFIVFVLCFSVINAKPPIGIPVVENGVSNYKIVISRNASHYDSLAAGEFRKYINEISGAGLEIVNDSHPVSEYEVVLGKTNRKGTPNISSVKYDGFVILTVRNKLFITGKEKKAPLNGIYTFFEKVLNCRYYSSKAVVIPKQKDIIIPPLNMAENPAFSYRSTHYYEANNGDGYNHWHKLVDDIDKKNTWGLFVHTFSTLMPPEKYFKEHPEYFAFRNGIRVPEEPCLSNPTVLKIMTEELRKRMKENPSARVWSVSQNDNYSNCQCDECKKLDDKEGSPSGSVLHFVNKIARNFPDKIISTLAYQYSRKPPLHIKPAKNVNIMLCSIECYRTEPLAADTSAGSFTKDLIGWSKITNNIFMWDYVVQFTNYMSPFPNFHTLQPNIQLFAKHGVNMIFEQGSGTTQDSEFGELRTYLISKLLWNPNLDIDSLENDFITGYYGNAGKYIKMYIDFITSNLKKSGGKLWIYDNPVAEKKYFLTPAYMADYNRIFDEAENSVNTEPEYLQRVKIARLPLTYAALEQAKVAGISDGGTFTKDDNGNYIVKDEINNYLNDLMTETQQDTFVLIHEKGLTVEGYVKRYKTMLEKSMYNPLGLFKPVTYISKPGSNYPANGEKTLTDGIRGDEDHHFNWQGFEGEDMEVVVDLEENKTVRKVSADFLQFVFSWIFLPEQVEVGMSTDGNNFTTAATVKSTVPLDKNGEIIYTFAADFNPVEARYVKVKAKSIKTCPVWHPGYPFKAWIFTDEIVIE
jgi:hypothetical protein